MSKESQFYHYLEDGVSFVSKQASSYRRVYMPLCGSDATSLKSSITPFLSGDSKIDKFSYLTKPMSTEDLRSNCRDFFVQINGKTIVSAAQQTQDSTVTAGQLWHKVTKNFPDAGLELQTLNFIPIQAANMELMKVTLHNTSDQEIALTPTSSIPLFARSLANKHDHEHVTSLLHRTQQLDCGIIVHPPMAFNEEGHTTNERRYFVFGVDDSGNNPTGSFPTFDSFFGEGGTIERPQAIYAQHSPQILDDKQLQGKETVGALRFDDVTLKAGEETSFIMAMGISSSEDEAHKVFDQFKSVEHFDAALEETKLFWKDKISSITLESGDQDFNAWMKWVTLQPVLRRIFGCSFLPDHDYGKGGKGWRDIWQDLLALILIEPKEVRDTLINNYAGVRIDGSNATIIGAQPGEFIADRNAITRVWMDHGAWPYLTTLLYINQTGDFDILFENNTYFRDAQIFRSFKRDEGWSSDDRQQLKDKDGNVYHGTVIEHILLQNLVQFFNVGEHNIIRLESADWNDGLDMAFDRGESVAFASFYAGNLISLAELLEAVQKVKGVQHITVLKEMLILLNTISGAEIDFNDWQAKKNILFDKYFPAVAAEICGETVEVSIEALSKDLRQKGQWLFDHIRQQEKIEVDGNIWFNGYYDNKGERVEGLKGQRVWMTLTGQVFAIMSGLATDDEIKQVVKSVNTYLKDPVLRGYRLNSDFGLDHYLDLGRAFGFAFGTKENGAFFSHMIVMYAYALYARGFVREGYEVLDSIYTMSTDGAKAQIYPGVPEYFDASGRGMYHYLTGSASWFVLTELVQVFGIKGINGNLVIEPKLVKEQFSPDGDARVSCQFASQSIIVRFQNSQLCDYGQYCIDSITCNGAAVEYTVSDDRKSACIARDYVAGLSTPVEFIVNLSAH